MPILLNRHTGLEEDADIVSPIGAAHIACYTSDWLPMLQSKVDELKQAGRYTLPALAENNVEDAHWEWSKKALERAGELQWNSYAVQCGQRTQGLMYVNLIPRCRLPEQVGEHMVTIDLLATAPWNRPNLAQSPVYRGVGGLLMTEAILLSRDEGFGGRIGLHALPRAANFYRTQWCMESLGADPHYGDLHYFELTAERAADLLGS